MLQTGRKNIVSEFITEEQVSSASASFSTSSLPAPSPSNHLPAQPTPGSHNSACTCRTASHLSPPLGAGSQRKDHLGCKSSHCSPASPAQSHHDTCGGAAAYGRCCGCFPDHCNPHGASQGRENPVPGLQKGKVLAKEVNSSLWK